VPSFFGFKYFRTWTHFVRMPATVVAFQVPSGLAGARMNPNLEHESACRRVGDGMP
jgi:hypothetical protein